MLLQPITLLFSTGTLQPSVYTLRPSLVNKTNRMHFDGLYIFCPNVTEIRPVSPSISIKASMSNGLQVKRSPSQKV